MQQPPSKSVDRSREKVFVATVLAVMAGQVAALWMLCSEQVRKAELRNASFQMERTALADCLQHMPVATLDSCATRATP